MSDEHPNSPEAWNERAKLKTSHEAAGCSREGQQVRHEVVGALLDLEDGDSVLDFGCGTGRFLYQLPSKITYVGYDWAPFMVHRARQEHGRGEFVNELPTDRSFDHVVAIGPFNLSDNWSIERTHETLAELWQLTNKSLIVSLLSGPAGDELSYDLDEAKRITELSSRFTITTDYLPNDIIVKLVRPTWDADRERIATERSILEPVQT